MYHTEVVFLPKWCCSDIKSLG